jgi:YVTN family beta-propeller protein
MATHLRHGARRPAPHPASCARGTPAKGDGVTDALEGAACLLPPAGAGPRPGYIAEIPTGVGPEGAAIDEQRHRAYVTASRGHSVTVVDLDRLRPVGEIGVGREPVGLFCSLDGGCLYVGNRGEGTVSVVDTRARSELARLVVGEAPAGCVIDPRTGWLLVSNAGSNTLTVLDPAAARPATAEAHPLVGRPLPPFALPALGDGRMHASREWSERLYILNFFASW